MSSTVTGVYVDHSISLSGNIKPDVTIERAVTFLANDIAKHVTKSFSLDLPLDPLQMQGKYYPAAAKPTDTIGSLDAPGLTALFIPNAEQGQLIKRRLSFLSNVEKENQVLRDVNGGGLIGNERKDLQGIDTSMLKELLTTVNGLKVTVEKQHSQLEEQRSRLGKQETVNQDLRSQLMEQRSQLGKQETINQDLRSQLMEQRSQLGKQETINQDLRFQLSQEKADRMQDIALLTRVTILITPLHLRALLDLARKTVLSHLNYETWEDLRQDRNVSQLADIIFRQLANAPHCPTHDTIEFLCSYNNVRRAGNFVAHSARQDEIRDAITRRPLDTHERECLEQLFVFTYGAFV